MQKGLSLHIGLNHFDPAHYGYAGRLRNCEADAAAMQSLARAQGFITAHLFSAAATRAAVLGWLHEAARRTGDGDLILVTYAGHGSHVPADDGMHETWCLHDAMLIDSELHDCFARFAAGVRIVVLPDTGHAGDALVENQPTRTLPPQIAGQLLKTHRAFYSDVLRPELRGVQARIKASVILIGGCQGNQECADGERHGLFTGTLLSLWDAGRSASPAQRTYRTLHADIAHKLAPIQTPRFLTRGAPSAEFENQAPLTI